MPKPEQKPAPLPDGTKVGNYRIVHSLSSGGFGVVYQAHDAEGGIVAIKEFLPAAMVKRKAGELLPVVLKDKQAGYKIGMKSFFEEGRTLAQISHPSVVRVQNFFKANDTIYMVMDFLEGYNLQDFIVEARGLHREKILRESTIVSLFNEVAMGLRAVHQHKTLHLDLKPANILITNDDRAVMVDFGAAREVISKGGKVTRPIYTPGFAAPEMYSKDARLGPWTDIYSLGASIFSCMTGKPPQDAPSRIKNDLLDEMIHLSRGVYTKNLIDLVLWCMKLQPTERPQSVLSMQRKLSEPRVRPAYQ